jgi:uncharacterized protein YbbK (DUF523 family)
MNNDIQPIVIVSKCLGFENCRYNSEIISDKFIDKLLKYVIFYPVCLENFHNMSIEVEGRLKKFTIREHFLTKLYTSTRFRIKKRWGK